MPFLYSCVWYDSKNDYFIVEDDENYGFFEPRLNSFIKDRSSKMLSSNITISNPSLNSDKDANAFTGSEVDFINSQNIGPKVSAE